VEDVGITLGQAFARRWATRRASRRYGHAYVPLDEALSRVVVDFSGRPGLHMHVDFKAGMIGGFDTQLAYEFFQGFVNHAQVTLHIDNLNGDNAHHQCETVFKAFARALRMALDARPARGRRRPVDQGQPVAMADGGRRRRLRHGQPALGVAGGAMHVAAGSGVEVVVTAAPRRCWPPTAWCCRGRARCATACASCATRAVRRRAARRAHKPLMGVCVGMQMLLEHSEEQDTPGLGLIPGEVRRFRLEGRLQPDGSRYKVPQMGWNRVRQRAAPDVGRRARRRLVLFRAQLLRRPPPRPPTAGRPTTACALPARWRGITFLPPSSTPRRAPSTGLALYRNFLHWKP
jgi:hypothetical protein